jgi:hypothetical protein
VAQGVDIDYLLMGKTRSQPPARGP